LLAANNPMLATLLLVPGFQTSAIALCKNGKKVLRIGEEGEKKLRRGENIG